MRKILCSVLVCIFACNMLCSCGNGDNGGYEKELLVGHKWGETEEEFNKVAGRKEDPSGVIIENHAELFGYVVDSAKPRFGEYSKELCGLKVTLTGISDEAATEIATKTRELLGESVQHSEQTIFHGYHEYDLWYPHEGVACVTLKVDRKDDGGCDIELYCSHDSYN